MKVLVNKTTKLTILRYEGQIALKLSYREEHMFYLMIIEPFIKDPLKFYYYLTTK